MWDWDEFGASCYPHLDAACQNLRQPLFYEQMSTNNESSRLSGSTDPVCAQMGQIISQMIADNKVHMYDDEITLWAEDGTKTTLHGDTHWKERWDAGGSYDHDGHIHLWSQSPRAMQTLRHEAAHTMDVGWVTDHEAEMLASKCQ